MKLSVSFVRNIPSIVSCFLSASFISQVSLVRSGRIRAGLQHKQTRQPPGASSWWGAPHWIKPYLEKKKQQRNFGSTLKHQSSIALPSCRQACSPVGLCQAKHSLSFYHDSRLETKVQIYLLGYQCQKTFREKKLRRYFEFGASRDKRIGRSTYQLGLERSRLTVTFNQKYRTCRKHID